MDILGVLFIVLSGSTLMAAAYRMFFGITGDVMIIASVVTVFGATLIALLVFVGLGMKGMFLTLISPMLLFFIFNRFGLRNYHEKTNNDLGLNFSYWILSLIVFSIFGVKSAFVSKYLMETYSIKNYEMLFNTVLGLSLLSGVISILMVVKGKPRRVQ